jgi:hypothetical protein
VVLPSAIAKEIGVSEPTTASAPCRFGCERLRCCSRASEPRDSACPQSRNECRRSQLCVLITRTEVRSVRAVEETPWRRFGAASFFAMHRTFNRLQSTNGVFLPQGKTMQSLPRFGGAFFHSGLRRFQRCQPSYDMGGAFEAACTVALWAKAPLTEAVTSSNQETAFPKCRFLRQMARKFRPSRRRALRQHRK